MEPADISTNDDCHIALTEDVVVLVRLTQNAVPYFGELLSRPKFFCAPNELVDPFAAELSRSISG
ncbi:MAG: hypothetical protein AAF517_27305 [Planctomycetota bacterium]